MIYDDRRCQLGEGPMWHPTRKQFFWFDILNKKLMTADDAWQFEDYVSAAGWVDDHSLMIASDCALLRFDIETGKYENICDLDADDPVTRSNDGRADPWGGFWIGTMGFHAEPGAGAIYRYYRGEVRKLFDEITVSNSICFTPDRRYSYFADTPTMKIMRQELEPKHGWPLGEPEVAVDVSAQAVRPDGSVVDAQGNIWNAQFGAGRVVCYQPDGTEKQVVPFPALRTTCPAFGGDDLSTLFCTSAAIGLSQAELAERPDSGKTFFEEGLAIGQAEHQVIL